MSSLQEKIARQREKVAEVKEANTEVVLGGEKTIVTIGRCVPDEWDALMAINPPRRGVESDAIVGYNPKGVSKSYPHVSVDGDKVTAEEWADTYSVLDSVWRNNIETLIWGVNIQETIKELNELGKARAGQSSH